MSMSRYLASAAALSGAFLLAACELGPKDVQQTGYRGLGLEQITDRNRRLAAGEVPPPPYALPPDEGPRASEAYENVQVLGDMSVERFNHLMAAITQWVSPEQGCTYCHSDNLAADDVYTKIVARQMLQMTRDINGTWASHVGQTGVTCYTCHRGNNVPQYVWANQPEVPRLAIRGQRRGQNAPDPNVGYSSLPYGIFQRYLAGDQSVVGVASDSAYPGTNPLTTRHAEDSYGIMMHVSQSLGVNCTYCHNSQSFRSWSLSSAQRATAWYGIRMVRDVNSRHIDPLQPVFPPHRLGAMGDPLKVNCLTCHQGQARPLAGAAMLNDYPYLRPVAAAAPAQPVGGEGTVPDALRRPGELTGRILPADAPGEERTPPSGPTLPAQPTQTR
jgi:photosynthetic reaction center cytochrome c subunit